MKSELDADWQAAPAAGCGKGSALDATAHARTMGHEPWRYYLQDFDRRFAQLIDHLELGRMREEIGAGLRSVPVGSHVVWYRLKEPAIEVVRVLHAVMDPATWLSP